MKILNKFLLFFSGLFGLMFLSFSQVHAAYFVAIHGEGPFNPELPSRVLVVGRGSDLGTLFQQAAASKAWLFRDLNPDEQVLLVTYDELGQESNTAKLQSWGFQVLKYSSDPFSEKALLQELMVLTEIKSFELFTHNSALYGSQLESKDHRINPYSKVLAPLAEKMTVASYAIFHGCNSGFYMAPEFSNMWGVPVLGSLTSTGFQLLHGDGNFYFTEDVLKPEGPWAWRNFASYNKKIECIKGACVRMKPDYHPYEGIFGVYKEGGLPFFKMFCAKNEIESCEKVMAQIMIESIHKKAFRGEITREKFQLAVIDWMCPLDPRNQIRQDCAIHLAKLEETKAPETYNPFQGKMLACGFDKCEFEMSCEKIGEEVNNKSCMITNPNRFTSTFDDEYLHYMRGYDLLLETNRE